MAAAVIGAHWRKLIGDVTGSINGDAAAFVLRQSGHCRPGPFLAAVACSLGTACDPYMKDWSRIIQPIGTKNGWSPDLDWHTDSSSWRISNSYTLLACERAAPRGGSTEMLSWRTVQSQLSDHPDLEFFVFNSPVAFRLEDDLGGGLLHRPIYSAGSARFMRGVITVLYQDGAAALRSFCELLDSLPPDACALLEPGDLVVFNNFQNLHRRGWVDDPDRVRMLLRIKVMRAAADRTE
jgi:Taurine catabolism dioxygenase TauD, TfdA family